MFLFKSFHVGLVRRCLCPVRFTVRLFLAGAVSGFDRAITALRCLSQSVCRIRAGVVVVVFSDIPMHGCTEGIHGSILGDMGQLGRRFLFLKGQARCDLPIGGDNALFNCFFRDFGLGLFEPVNGLSCLLRCFSDYGV